MYRHSLGGDLLCMKIFLRPDRWQLVWNDHGGGEDDNRDSRDGARARQAPAEIIPFLRRRERGVNVNRIDEGNRFPSTPRFLYMVRERRKPSRLSQYMAE
ncbi:hypothetical protein Ddc_05414 [Ditylenchus destructor]|nr:hypothetical protein Ddc_05414 [Ditylenchus destructor]